MKKVLVATLVLALAGLVGTLSGPWARSLPDAVRAEVAKRQFFAQRARMYECANERLPYSGVIGTILETRARVLRVYGILVVEPGVTDRAANILAQLQVVVACAREVQGWDRLVFTNVAMEVVTGFNVQPNGQPTSVAIPTMLWAIGMDKAEAALYLRAFDLEGFVNARVDDNTVDYRFLGYFAIPVSFQLLDSTLVHEALVKHVESLADSR